MMDTKPRVLLVNDETAITANLAPFLTRAGFEVAMAADSVLSAWCVAVLHRPLGRAAFWVIVPCESVGI